MASFKPEGKYMNKDKKTGEQPVFQVDWTLDI